MRSSSTKRISAVIRREAESWQLGPLQRAYRLGGIAGLYRILGLLCLLFGAGLIGIFFYLYNDIFSWWLLWQAALIPGIGLCWMLIGIWIVVSAFLTRSEHIYIFAKGLIYRKRAFQVVRWNQTAKLWQRDGTISEPACFILQFREGPRIVLPADLTGIQALYHFLEDLVTRREVTRGREYYMAGNVLDFGALALSREGLVVTGQQKTLSWNNFACIAEDQAALCIYDHGHDHPWVTLESAELYNRKACMELAQLISAEHGRQEQLARGATSTSPHQIAQIAEFEQGIAVAFGALRISKQGVEIASNVGMLLWKEIACIGVAQNALVIRRQGNVYEWHASPTWAMTDTAALKELVTYIMSKKDPGIDLS